MLNNVSLIGRITADPELKTTNTDSKVLSFCLAVQRDYVKHGEERQSDFIDFVAWNKTEEIIAKYLHKGSSVGVTGRVQTRSFEDKDGKKRKATEVVVQNVSFIERKADPGDFIEVDDEDIPF